MDEEKLEKIRRRGTDQNFTYSFANFWFNFTPPELNRTYPPVFYQSDYASHCWHFILPVYQNSTRQSVVSLISAWFTHLFFSNYDPFFIFFVFPFVSCFVSCWNPLHARLFFFSISEWNLRRTNTKMIIFKTTSNVIWDWERKNVVESRKTDQPKGIEMNCSDIPPLFNKSIKRLSKGFRLLDAFFLFNTIRSSFSLLFHLIHTKFSLFFKWRKEAHCCGGVSVFVLIFFLQFFFLSLACRLFWCVGYLPQRFSTTIAVPYFSETKRGIFLKF